jgi:NAD(P)-dependent dehydrogenase (short-subunit alcohol dehydrogenase family)
MASLTNKTALVTGASRGIGRATASVLANAGAHVLVHFGHSAPDAESTVADIRSRGGRADTIRADLRTPDGAALLAKDVRSIVGERLDVLVLNAADNFKAVITAPAWRSKPSWMLVATKDRTINPDLERWYAARAKSHKVEVSGASHSVYVSRPKEVAALIEEAASHAPSK